MKNLKMLTHITENAPSVLIDLRGDCYVELIPVRDGKVAPELGGTWYGVVTDRTEGKEIFVTSTSSLLLVMMELTTFNLD